MKKLLLIVIPFLFFSCASTPSSVFKATDKVVGDWATGLQDKKIEILMTTYWPDAVFTFFPLEGDKMILTGSEQIRSGQSGSMESPETPVINLDSALRRMENGVITYTVPVEFPDFTLTNILELEERHGEWKIINQTVEF